MIRFDIITIFPHIFDSYFSESILKRAQLKKKVAIVAHDLRDFTKLRHRKVDDAPYGGGAGMVLQVEPIYRAVQSLIATRPASTSRGEAGNAPSLDEPRRGGQRAKRKRTRIILFSTRGKKLDAKAAKRLSTYDQLILICGRYEGVDERVAAHIADEEVSIGDYVLSGGELPAMVLVEAVSRFIPGVLGTYESLEEVKGSYPVYTRPEVFMSGKSHIAHRTSRGWRVPKVLLSGDHAAIEKWRRKRAGG